MAAVKTNEIEGTRAVLRYCRMSAYKAREVLDLIRGQDVARASEILRFSERDAAHVVGKLLDSAVANARNNDELDPEELYVSTCYADEGATIKRWRPRARGRATRIRKRTCHITVIVSRMPEDRLERVRARQAAELAMRRARRVAGQRAEARRTRGPAAEAEVVDEAEVAELAEESDVTEATAVVEAPNVAEESEAAEESTVAGGSEVAEAGVAEEVGEASSEDAQHEETAAASEPEAEAADAHEAHEPKAEPTEEESS